MGLFQLFGSFVVVADNGTIVFSGSCIWGWVFGFAEVDGMRFERLKLKFGWMVFNVMVELSLDGFENLFDQFGKGKNTREEWREFEFYMGI